MRDAGLSRDPRVVRGFVDRGMLPVYDGAVPYLRRADLAEIIDGMLQKSRGKSAGPATWSPDDIAASEEADQTAEG